MESELHGVLNRRAQWVRDAKRDERCEVEFQNGNCWVTPRHFLKRVWNPLIGKELRNTLDAKSGKRASAHPHIPRAFVIGRNKRSCGGGIFATVTEVERSDSDAG